MMGGKFSEPPKLLSPLSDPPQPARANDDKTRITKCLPQIRMMSPEIVHLDYQDELRREEIWRDGTAPRKRRILVPATPLSVAAVASQTGSFASPPRDGFANAFEAS